MRSQSRRRGSHALPSLAPDVSGRAPRGPRRPLPEAARDRKRGRSAADRAGAPPTVPPVILLLSKLRWTCCLASAKPRFRVTATLRHAVSRMRNCTHSLSSPWTASNVTANTRRLSVPHPCPGPVRSVRSVRAARGRRRTGPMPAAARPVPAARVPRLSAATSVPAAGDRRPAAAYGALSRPDGRAMQGPPLQQPRTLP